MIEVTPRAMEALKKVLESQEGSSIRLSFEGFG